MAEINEFNVLEKEPIIKESAISSEVSVPVANIGNIIQNKARAGMVDPMTKYGFSDYSAINTMAKDNRIQAKAFDIGKEAYVELSSGKLIPRFESYIPGVNNEEILASRQSSGEKWSNGSLKALGKVGVNILGGTIGAVEGLISGIRNQSLSAIFTSDFNTYLEDLNKKLDYNLPNYYTEQEKNMNFGQKLGTSNFWADDALGGLSFMVGTIVSEGLWAAATGGGSLIAKGAIGGLGRFISRGIAGGLHAALNEVKGIGKKMIRGSLTSKVDDVVSAGIKANNITKGMNTARFLYTSAGFEAAVEARGYLEEAKTNFKNQYYEQYGRPPSTKELGEFSERATGVGNTLFAGNLALVGTSNFVVLGRLLLNKAPTRKVSSSFFKKYILGVGLDDVATGGVKAVKASKFQKVFGKVYSVGKPMFMEGAVEEGGQAVMSTAANDYILSAYDRNNINGGLSMIEALTEGLEYAYTSKQGLTEVGLGALIGILGGGAASKFKFNEVSQERDQVEAVAENINQFHRGNLIETLKYNAKVNAASSASEKARAEGDLTSEMRSDTAAMTALVERSSYYKSTEETRKDFNAAIDAMNSADLAKQLGISEEEVADWKDNKKGVFNSTLDMHTKHMRYADAFVGGTPIAGIDKLDASGVVDLKSAIAYTLTMGMKSEEFTENLALQIKATVSDYLTMEDGADAITVNEVLRKVGEEKTKAYGQASMKLSKVSKQIQGVETALVEAQNLEEVEEGGGKKAKKIGRLTVKLTKLQEEATRLQGEKTLAYDAMNISQLTNEVVTEEMLDNQEKSVNQLKTTIDSIAIKDVEKANYIERLHKEYLAATQNSKAFSNLVQTMVNPETKAHTLSGWAASIYNKKKELGGDTAEVFIEAINNYQMDSQKLNIYARALEEESSTEQKEETKEEENKSPLEETPEDFTEEAREAPNASSARGKVIEILKAKLKEVLKTNPYTSLRYDGTESNDIEEVRPTQENIDRYNELLDKINPNKRFSTIVQKPYNKRNKTGLTEEETNELKGLNLQLNSWKILSGVNKNDNAVSEILQLIHQLERSYKFNGTNKKTEVKEFMKPEKAETSESTGSKGGLNTVVSPDIAVAKKSRDSNSYEISHVSPYSMTKLFPGTTMTVMVNNKEVDVETLPKDLKDTLEKEAGTEFILNTEGGKVKVTLSDRQRLVIGIEELNDIIGGSEIRILDFGNSSFMPIFVKRGEEYIPLEGDFKVKSVNDNEIINLNPEGLYSMKEGDKLRTVVNLNDTYNSKLLKDYKDKKITKEELINSIHIYLAPQGAVNDIVGSLRAILPSSNPSTDTFNKLYIIRKIAVEKALDSKTNKVEVGITIGLGTVLMGSPNITVTEKGEELTPVNIPISQEALGAIEDYGYILNGEVFSNKNLQYTNKEATFARKVSNRTENTGQKIPVVVFDYKGRKVVFPVSLVESKGTKANEVLGILNNDSKSEMARIVEVNQVLIDNNINPNEYKITDLESDLSIQEVNRLIKDLGEVTDTANVDTWLESNYDKSQLAQEAEIAIDITDKPFNAPKGVLNFKNIDVPNEDDLEIDSVDSLDRLAKKVNSRFSQENPFSEMVDNSEFYDAFEEEGINKNAENYINKKRNANILRNAFDTKIPRRVSEVLGEDLIKEIRAELKKYKLINEGLDTNTSFIDKSIKSEIDNLKNNCS